MYVSMTGFSSTSRSREWGVVTLDLSSVNHRYQEIFVRLPRELSSWEPWFHQRLREAFRRGKVQARVEILWAMDAAGGSVNRDALRRYYDELSALREAVGGREIALEALLALPGVLETQERTRLAHADETEALLSELLTAGIEGWQAMRAQEGAHLEEAVSAHLGELDRLTSEIARRWGPAKDAAFAAMIERVRRALAAAGVSLGEQAEGARFVQEAVILADRWDVSEELARLASHAEKFRQAGRTERPKDSIGRKLDFLVQEMNREVNTLDSKIADAEIRWLAVEAKAALERIREQIQNLE